MTKERTLLLVIALNAFIIAAELLFGYLAGSYAIIADALHNLWDMAALLLAFAALRLQSRPPDYRFTYGFAKAEAVAGFLNALLLGGAMLWLSLEALQRLRHPEPVDGGAMVAVGLAAFAANGVSAYLLHRAQDHRCGHDLGIRGAFLHMAADAALSLGVAAAGALIWLFGSPVFDPLATLLIAAIVLYQSLGLLKASLLHLLDANLAPANYEEIKKTILGADSRIAEFHDLHIHSPSSRSRHISFHLVLREPKIRVDESDRIIARLRKRLEKLGFGHVVIQVESRCRGLGPFCVESQRAEARRKDD